MNKKFYYSKKRIRNRFDYSDNSNDKNRIQIDIDSKLDITINQFL